MHVEDISFAGAEVQLSGSVIVPDVAEECPGVVLVGGSGPSDRHNSGLFDVISDYLARSGVAGLVYDKRGVGGSSGLWAAATLDELASDAASAVRVLRSRSGIGTVGVLGHSEGGWVALRLAAREPMAGHLILQSCPATSFIEAEMFALTHAGMSPEDAEAVGALMRDLADTAPSDEGFAEAELIVAAAQIEPWYAFVEAGGFCLDRSTWEQIRVWGTYDPRADLERLALPTLVVFGADDPLVPVEASIEGYKTTGARTGRRQRVAVFAGADHRLKLRSGDLAPRYLPTLAGWSKRE